MMVVKFISAFVTGLGALLVLIFIVLFLREKPEPKLVLIEPESKVAESMCDGFGGLNYVVSRSSRVSVARHVITITAECKDGSELTRIVSVK